MSDRRAESPAEHRADAHKLAHLAARFEIEAEALAKELCQIVEWLRSGGLEEKPARALTDCPDKMNAIRHLLGEIEHETQRADRSHHGV